MVLRFRKNNTIYSDFSFEYVEGTDTDLARLKKGLVGGQFWSVFVPWFLWSFLIFAKSSPHNDTTLQSTVIFLEGTAYSGSRARYSGAN